VGQEGFKASVARLARNVRARRLELNLTQEDVAFDAGLSARHYQQLESGAANPTYQTLFEVAGVLWVTLVDLIEPAHRAKIQRRRASRKGS
jgi:transcriptional regulator with XRE-family HTH domain